MSPALSRRYLRQVPPQLAAGIIMGLLASRSLFPRVQRSLPAPAVPQFLSLPEAALFSGLSEQLLQRLIDTGKLPSLKDGQVVKVPSAKLASLSGLAKVTKELRGVVKNRRKRNK